MPKIATELPPKIGLERSEIICETIDDTLQPKENIIQTGNEIIQVAPEQLILTKQKITKYESKYNKDKYKQIDRTIAQVDSEEVVKNTYLSHPNLEIMKFLIDKPWATVTTRKKKQYCVNKNFVRFSDAPTSEISKDDF
ncbi:MAG: hypothetical protein EZS28_004638 [Streblomastix strix]|uniref:Uncharacterized protein n=1 Tax=Streblomastix strix TaxID=222440 RepID=A0A5J4WYD8_9EUKA|nr:MAG: hypothetical protein EZS28_004638 [Streblomastix strix]